MLSIKEMAKATVDACIKALGAYIGKQNKAAGETDAARVATVECIVHNDGATLRTALGAKGALFAKQGKDDTVWAKYASEHKLVDGLEATGSAKSEARFNVGHIGAGVYVVLTAADNDAGLKDLATVVEKYRTLRNAAQYINKVRDGSMTRASLLNGDKPKAAPAPKDKPEPAPDTAALDALSQAVFSIKDWAQEQKKNGKTLAQVAQEVRDTLVSVFAA